jgi:molybdopterin/thiamine biosynthesis adenylyltransferase
MPETLARRLAALARDQCLADGSACRTIGVADVIQLSAMTGVSGREVEIAALEQQILPDRYLRNRRTLSMGDQIRLLESAVCIVGLGGLGGLVTDTLARTGVGRLQLIDGDCFEAHNLNRQLLCDTGRLGQPKAAAAAARVEAINPGIVVGAAQTYLEPDNADGLLAGCDLAADCLDNIPSRFTLAAAARRAGIPMVSTAVAGIGGHLTTILPSDTGLSAIYGPADRLDAAQGAELQLGCLASGVNLMASLACTEIIKVLTGRDHLLSKRLLVVDLADYTFEKLQLE